MSKFPPIEDLVPHKAGMLLIDKVVAAEGETVRSESTIRPSGIFFQRGRGMPAYVGFELMAQTISAYDGLRRHADGKAPAIGLLLGCRKYSAKRPFFVEGERLTIEATSLLNEDDMASFECRIMDADGGELANAVINVYRPTDPEAFLQAQL